jgi:hypothetical protein
VGRSAFDHASAVAGRRPTGVGGAQRQARRVSFGRHEGIGQADLGVENCVDDLVGDFGGFAQRQGEVEVVRDVVTKQ